MSVKEGFFSFGFKLFLALVLGLVLSDAILYYITDHTIGDSYYDALVILDAARQTTFALTITLNAIIHLGVLIVIFAASLVMSNKIAGPMYRFENVARSVKEGDLGVDVRLRQGDFMRSQAEDFDEALRVMCGRIEEARKAARDAKEKLAGMEPGEKAPGGTAELVRGMREDVGRLRECLSFFKT